LNFIRKIQLKGAASEGECAFLGQPPETGSQVDCRRIVDKTLPFKGRVWVGMGLLRRKKVVDRNRSPGGSAAGRHEGMDLPRRCSS
jgi:hypothetical protein